MKKTMLAAFAALAAPAAAFATHDTVGLIGTVVQECHEKYVLAVEGGCEKYALTNGNFCHLAGKRVEVIGRLERGSLRVSALHELLPIRSDLVVTVDVKYGGHGEAFVGVQRAGAFDRSQVRFARRVNCGNRITLRIPVRTDEARCGARYQIVMFAEERQQRTRTCYRDRRGSTLVVRHELSQEFVYERGGFRDACGRRIREARVSLCL